MPGHTFEQKSQATIQAISDMFVQRELGENHIAPGHVRSFKRMGFALVNFNGQPAVLVYDGDLESDPIPLSSAPPA